MNPQTPIQPSQATPGQGAAVAAIAFALQQRDMEVLRLWYEGEFDQIRREWPEAPAAIFEGADPLLTAPVVDVATECGEDAANFRFLANAFDNSKSSTSERILDDLGLPTDNAHLPFAWHISRARWMQDQTDKTCVQYLGKRPDGTLYTSDQFVTFESRQDAEKASLEAFGPALFGTQAPSGEGA